MKNIFHFVSKTVEFKVWEEHVSWRGRGTLQVGLGVWVSGGGVRWLGEGVLLHVRLLI